MMRYTLNVFATLMLSAAIALPAASLAKSSAAAGQTVRTMTITVGSKHELNLYRPVTAFRIVNPEVLDARALDSSRVELTGKAPGNSLVVAYDSIGTPVYKREIRVIRRAARTGQSVILQNGKSRIVYSCTGNRCTTASVAKP